MTAKERAEAVIRAADRLRAMTVHEAWGERGDRLRDTFKAHAEDIARAYLALAAQLAEAEADAKTMAEPPAFVGTVDEFVAAHLGGEP